MTAYVGATLARKRWNGRGPAAVVADLQQVGVQRLAQHLPLTGRFRIAFEQHGSVPIGHVQHQ